MFELSVTRNNFRDKVIKEYIEKYLNPVNEHYLNPKTASDWAGWFELNHKSDALYHKYYRLALDYENQSKFNKDNVYLKGRDIKEANIKNFIKNEIFSNKLSNSQFDSMDVVIPQYGSPLVQTVLNSYELKSELRKIYNEIQSGKWRDKAKPIHFLLNPQLSLSIGNGLLFDIYVKDDYVCASLIDYYNFKKGVYEYNIAYAQQASGAMTNYLLIFPIHIPVEEIFE